MNRCPHCGERLDAVTGDLVAGWRAQCHDAGMPLINGLVGEATAAKLLQVSAKWLQRLRAKDSGPRWSRIPVAGARVSYALTDLAEFHRAQRNGDSWD